MIDLANLPDPVPSGNRYDVGDKVLIIAYKENQHDAAMYTVAGQDKDQSLYMNPVEFRGRQSGGVNDQEANRLMQLLTANTASSTGYYCKVWALSDGELLAMVETLAGSSIPVMFGHSGKPSGGFAIERENKALVVTVTMK